MAGVATCRIRRLCIPLLALLLAGCPVRGLPLPSGQQRQAPAQASNADHAGQVWVNTKTKIYHLPSSKWAGNTKQGKWMTEAEAQRQGYRKALNE